ncbi:MAG: TadE/TadG family type IV pilus assembly protein [Planctomycetota bacterium]
MKRRSKRHRRKGAVTVEFALIAPIFFTLIFGSVEFARVHMIQTAVENACFEAARRGTVPGADESHCLTRANELMDVIGVQGNVTVEPSTINAATPQVTVTIQVPLTAENGFGFTSLFSTQAMTKSVTLSID